VNENIYYSTGDLGDIVASLPAVRAICKGNYFIGEMWEGQRESMRGTRFDAIKPLLEIQPYIERAIWTETFPKGARDFSTFREKYRVHENLAIQQARHIGVEISLDPWLTIDQTISGGAIIARTSRYRNSLFPWRKILSHFPDRAFVGSPQEHKDFESLYGEIGFLPTKDLLELARVIAGAQIIVCNQSCPFWIAAGLGIPIIQETFWADMNSVIERPNCRYTRNVSELNSLLDSL